MTAEPQRNTPLTADDVKLLRKGDWLCVWFPPALNKPDEPRASFQFSHLTLGNVIHDAEGLTMVNASRVRFLGRPDQSGWIPHSGGENPAPGLDIHYRLGDGFLSITKSDFLHWGHDVSRKNCIVAWRPHVPAPAGEQALAATPSPSVEAAAKPMLCNVCNGFVPTWSAAKLCSCEYHAPFGAHPAPDASAVREGCVSVPRDLVLFLLGEGSFEGRDFADEPPRKAGYKQPYWWRHALRQALTPSEPAGREELREKVAERLHDRYAEMSGLERYADLSHTEKGNWRFEADQILALLKRA